MMCLFLLALITISVLAFLQFDPVFGGQPDAQSLKKIHASPHFSNGRFHNFEPTSSEGGGTPIKNKPNIFKWLYSILQPKTGKHPTASIPAVKFELAKLKNEHFVWFGHSTVLMRLADQTILFDPVFTRASPIFIGGNPYPADYSVNAKDIPLLDAVVISHDHYDHLDEVAIRQLTSSTAQFYVPLGVKAHLQRWGVPNEKIKELDWFESAKFGALTFTLLPSRHYGGRRFDTKFTTLWGAWAVRSPHFSVYFSGDSGYGKHFAQAHERFGDFDVVFIENGSYNPDSWPDHHMTPEQSVQASLDLGARLTVPIHWGRFDMAYHPWKEPIERFTQAAALRELTIATPKIGEIFSIHHPPTTAWWETIE